MSARENVYKCGKRFPNRDGGNEKYSAGKRGGGREGKERTITHISMLEVSTPEKRERIEGQVERERKGGR